jgi:hypothetical protein
MSAPPIWPARGSVAAIPTPIAVEDAALYRLLREAHCDRNATAHQCAGKVTIDRAGVSLQCPLCGDARGVMPPQLPVVPA